MAGQKSLLISFICESFELKQQDRGSQWLIGLISPIHSIVKMNKDVKVIQLLSHSFLLISLTNGTSHQCNV